MINCLRRKIRRFLRVDPPSLFGPISFGVLELKQDDLLVISSEQCFSKAFKEKLIGEIREHLPESIRDKVVVMEAGLKLSTVREAGND